MSTTQLAAVDRPSAPAREPAPRLRVAEPRPAMVDRAPAPRSVEIPAMVVDATALAATALAVAFAGGHAREVFSSACLALLSMVLRGAYRPRLRRVALDGMARSMVSVGLGGMASFSV